MPKIAWAKKLYNAYNCVNINDKIFSEQGVLAGKATTWKAKPTQNSPGSVQLNTGIWISGDLEKMTDGWKITKNCSIS